MATLLESNFITATHVANSTRQAAIAAAVTAYGGVFANLATYQAAIVAADNAWIDAVQAAATTAGIQPGASGGLYPGMVYGKWASLTT